MNYKILVIEDDLEIQELIKQFLKTQNYTLAVASDGGNKEIKYSTL